MLTLKYLQKLPISMQESWEFFSSPTNLKILTPQHLNFEIVKDHGHTKMYAGQIIAYRIRPILNFPIEWVSEISHIQEPYYFIDEQLFGPYKFWHHEHRFNPIPNGVEVVDTIHYKLPFGFLGKVLQSKVKQDLESIFSFRRAKLEELFGSYLG